MLRTVLTTSVALSVAHYLPHWDSWVAQAQTDVKAKELVERYQHRPREELFDLRSDPFAMSNLADNPEQAELLDSLRGRLRRWCQIQGDQAAVTALSD